MAEKKETKKQELNELVFIQSTLKAPKNQRNNFGGYNYRSCEDIMEAVKPLLKEMNCTLVISDEIVQVADRIYVKATATLKTPSGEEYKNTAYAREALSKKGMDESQVTGAASSYARKYALNGLFCIDDTKDADALNVNKEYTQQPAQQQVSATALNKALAEIDRCKTRDELITLNNRYQDLWNDAKFVQARDNKYNSLQQ